MKQVLLALSFLLLSLPARADLNSMRERIPTLVEMKEKGTVGEQLDGLLGVVSQAAGAEAVVKAENADRLSVYKDRAKSQGVDLATFMKVMGEERIKQEKSGRYVQDAQGRWTKKP
jgi:uncharacterized protein